MWGRNQRKKKEKTLDEYKVIALKFKQRMDDAADDDEEAHKSGKPCLEKIAMLESCVTGANRMQGLGFTVPGGKVVDRRTLQAVLTTLAGVAGTVGPVVFALHESALASVTEYPQTDLCNLSVPQIALIQAAASLNSTCAYNMTIRSVLEL